MKWNNTNKVIEDEMLYKGGKYRPRFKRCTKTADEINLRLRALAIVLEEYERTPKQLGEQQRAREYSDISIVFDPDHDSCSYPSMSFHSEEVE